MENKGLAGRKQKMYPQLWEMASGRRSYNQKEKGHKEKEPLRPTA